MEGWPCGGGRGSICWVEWGGLQSKPWAEQEAGEKVGRVSQEAEERDRIQTR